MWKPAVEKQMGFGLRLVSTFPTFEGMTNFTLSFWIFQQRSTAVPPVCYLWQARPLVS
jgi:hypothetical protein